MPVACIFALLIFYAIDLFTSAILNEPALCSCIRIALLTAVSLLAVVLMDRIALCFEAGPNFERVELLLCRLGEEISLT